MSIRRGMLFTLGAKIKNLIDAFKARVLNTQGQFEAESCLNTQLTELDNDNLLDNASLVVTPNGYKETLLYAVEPNEVGTNLFLRSEEFETTNWIKFATSILQNTEIAPNGTLTADTLRIGIDASAIRHRLYQNVLLDANTYTSSYYLKKANHRWIQLVLPVNTDFGLDAWANFDLEDGVIGNTGTGAIATITNVGGGWYRCTLQATKITTSSSAQICDVLPTNNTNSGRYPSYQSTVAEDVCYVWGAQLVPGSTITDYISTTDRAIINGTIGDMSVTRATTATRVNADGFIEEVPYNLLSQSQNFENGFWNKQRTTIGQNVIAAPDGTLTADNLIANSGVTYDYTGVNGVNVVSTSFLLNTDQRTLSFYLKYNGLNRIRVIYGSATSLGGAVFVEVDLQLGIITTSNGGIVASNFFIEDAGNNWYRVGFNLITTLSTTNNRFAVGLGDTTKTIANGIDGVYLWGAQLVTGAQPKDYFPTTNRFNVPRIDYSNGSCPSILVEPQRTNLVLRSEEFENASWVKDNSSILTNTAISPSNVLNADTYIGNGLNLQHFIYQNLSVTSGITYSISIYAKKDTNNFIQLCGSNAAFGVNCFANFDISNGTIGTIGSATIASIDSVGNGWYRLKITSTAIATTTVAPILISLITSSTSIKTETNNLSTSVYLWGAQLEAGTNVTSYIPTVASTVTRNADVITNTNASTLIGQTEGTIFVEFYGTLEPLNIKTLLVLFTDVVNEHITLQTSNNQQNLALSITTAGTSLVGILTPLSGLNKLVVVYSTAGTKIFLNGVQQTSLSTTAIPAMSTIHLGHRNGLRQWGFINEFYLSKTQITDAQAIQLTTL
jgi:hypothetical protein